MVRAEAREVEGRGQVMPGSKIGRLCNFLPSALCLGDLWLQPGKRTAGTVSVGRLNQCVVRVLQKPR